MQREPQQPVSRPAEEGADPPASGRSPGGGALSAQRREGALFNALVGITREVAAWSDEQTILSKVVETARRLLDAGGVMVLLRSADGRAVTIGSHAGFTPQQIDFLMPYQDDIPFSVTARRIFEQGEILALPDVRTDPLVAANRIVQQLGVCSVYVFPLRYVGTVLGALALVYNDQPHALSPEESEWLMALANQSALALALGRILREQRHGLLVREALYTASQRLQSSADIGTVIEATLNGVEQVVPCVGVSIHLLSEDGKWASVAGALGYRDSALAANALVGYTYPADDSRLNSRTLLGHEAFFLHDFQLEAEKWSNAEMPTLRAWMSVPLLSNDRCLGKITVDHERVGVYGPEELAIVQTFAAHAAVAMERARLFTERTEQAESFAALALHTSRQHAELVKREEERSILLRQLLTAQENERKLIAIELHDGPLQSLGVGLVNADALRKKIEAGYAATASDVADLRAFFAAVVDEIRGLMADLRPEVLDSYGLLPALQVYVRRFQQTSSVEVQISDHLKERLPAYLEITIYRLVQEALNNVRKHSGATSATVLLAKQPGEGQLVIKVTDDGRGFDPGAVMPGKEGFRLGIKSMEERARGAGGNIRIESAPGKGTSVIVTLPWPGDPAPPSA